MIMGVGTDITEIGRVRDLLQGNAGERFLGKILTERERELARRKEARLAEFAAGRFAAKEAVAKAFGCGIGEALKFHDIEIVPDEHGKPVCHISEQARVRRERGPFRLHLSISHSRNYATAIAVVEAADATST